jgi:hypothetical protein
VAADAAESHRDAESERRLMAAAVAPGIESFSQMSNRTKAVVMAGTLQASLQQRWTRPSSAFHAQDHRRPGRVRAVQLEWGPAMLASTATVPVIGKLTDIFGRKPFYMAESLPC